MLAWADGVGGCRRCSGRSALSGLLLCLAALGPFLGACAAQGQEAGSPGPAAGAQPEAQPAAAPQAEAKPAAEPAAPESKTEAAPAAPPAAGQPPAPAPGAEQPKPAPATPQAKPPEPPKPVELPPGIIARVNGQDLTQKEMEKCLLQFFAERAREMIIQQTIIRQEAAAQGLTVTEQDLDEMENEFYTKNPFPAGTPLSERKAKWAESLAAHAMSREDFRHQLEVDVLLKKLVSRRVQISDEQVQRLFLSRHGQRLVLRQIVVKTKEEAEELHKQLTAGASFEGLAKAKSLDLRTRQDGGKLREPLARGKGLNAHYEEAAFHLEIGQISVPLEVNGKWYILKLEDKVPGDDVKFEDVKEKYRQELAGQEEARGRDALMRELMQKAKIERGRFAAPPQEGTGAAPAAPGASEAPPPAAPESKGAAP